MSSDNGNSDDERAWDKASWEGARREEIRRWASMPLERILAAQEEMHELAAAFGHQLDTPTSTDTGRAPDMVGEPAQGYQHGDGPHEIVLEGCQPIPLASYLKALGILRLVSEQADGGAQGFWTDSGFVLRTSLTVDRLREFLGERYVPTPILAPWNGGSGFYAGDNTSGIGPMRAADAPRFQSLRHTISTLTEVVREQGLQTRPAGTEKARFIANLRAEANDAFLDWLDAAVLLTEEDPRYPPLLGTGGNDGRLDFTNNFLQRLVELFDPGTGRMHAGSVPYLEAALFAAPVPGMANSAIGQFMPGAAGGPNASSGFEGESLVNPWDFILMLEGALLFAATATRRNTLLGEGQMSYPFTVRPTGAGSGAASMSDESAARAEFWAPLWDRPLSLKELRALLGEGRATFGQRAARDGLDFARAVAALGVERGISAFQRYGFMMRSGKAYLATPLNRVPVRRNPDVDLIEELESNQFLGRFRRFARGASHQAQSLARVLEDRLFQLAQPAQGHEQERTRRVQAVIEALGAIVRYLSVSPAARKECPRLPWLEGGWTLIGDDASPEFRVAAALAGMNAGRMPFICHLLPVDPTAPTRYDEESRLAVWRQGDLVDNLGAVLRRRLLEVERSESGADKPFQAQPAAQLSSIAAFLNGATNDERLARLVAGLALVRRPPFELPALDELAPLPAAYRCLKPLFCTDEQLRRVAVLSGDEHLPLPRRLPGLLVADRVSAALDLGLHRQKASGIPVAFGNLDAAVDGPRLLAALMVPLSDAALRDLLGRIHTPASGGAA